MKQEASSAVQQQASSAVQQQASSAVQQQASSATQQAASSAVQQQASSAVQQQASSAVQQKASSAQQIFSTTEAAIAAASSSLQSTNVSVSSTAAQTLGNLAATQAQALISSGSSDAASTILIDSLTVLRSSTAFTSGDPATVALVSQLTSLQQSTVQSNPNASASAAQASAATSNILRGLQSTDYTSFFAAALQLSQNAKSQANYLIAIGDYRGARTVIQNTISILTQAISNLRSSTQTGGSDNGANGPTVTTIVSELSTLLSSIEGIDPVSVATASAAKQKSASAAQQQSYYAEQQAASSAVKQAASAAVQQRASAADSIAISNLNNPSVAISSAAVQTLASDVTAEVQGLLASGSYSAASTTLIETLNMLRNSSAFAAGDSATLAAIASLTTLAQTTLQSNPNAAASAATASAASSTLAINLASTSPSVSIPAAQTLTSNVTSQVQYLVAIGSYAQAEALIEQTIQQLNTSPSASSSDVRALISQLQTLQSSVTSIDPVITASMAQQKTVSAANSVAVSNLNNSSVAVSSAAAQTLATNITAQVQGLLASGSYSAASTILIETLNTLRNSSAFAAGDPATVAAVASLTALEQTTLQSNPNAAASAATASAASSTLASNLASTSPSVSLPAAQAITANVKAQVQYLVAIGSYAQAEALIQQTIQQLNASPSASSSDVRALVSQLQALETSVVSIDPVMTASTAQRKTASAANSVAVSNLNNSSVAVSSAAAQTLATNITAQVQGLLASGSYSAASTILIETLNTLRSSSAFAAGDPATLAAVASLTALEQTTLQSNPNAAASAATASAASSTLATNLASTSPSVSLPAAQAITANVTAQVQYLMAIGSYAQAEALIQQTVQQLNTSPSASSTDVQVLVSQLQALQTTVVASDPASKASAAQASAAQPSAAQPSAAQASAAQPSAAQPSAAQQYYTTALQSSNLQSSVAAANQLTQSVTSTVQTLVSLGSFSTAIAVLTQTIQLLYSSTAYKQNDPTVIALIQGLTSTLQQAEKNNVGETVSAAKASSAQAYYMSQLQSPNITVSVSAAKDIVATVNLAVTEFVTMGFFSTADTLITETIQALKSSSAFTSGNADVIAMISSLTALQASIVSMDPSLRSPSTSGPSAAAPAEPANSDEFEYGYGYGYGYADGIEEGEKQRIRVRIRQLVRKGGSRKKSSRKNSSRKNSSRKNSSRKNSKKL
jgi:hypothetical protein